MFSVFFTIGLFAQSDLVDFNSEIYKQSAVISNTKSSPEDFFYNFKFAREFELNPVLKNEDNVFLGLEISLNLFPSENFIASIEKVSRDINNTLVLKASIKNYSGAFCIITTNTDGISSLRIEIPQLDKCYSTVFNPETGLQYLTQLDMERREEIKCEPFDSGIGLSLPRNENSYNMKDLISVAEIDIMVVYSPAAEAYAIANNGGMNNVIANFMAASQIVMDNSLVDVGVNLIYSQLINYTESGNYSTDLFRLQDPHDGIMDEVHQWRRHYNADLVFFVILNQDVGGSAYLLTDPAGQPNCGFGIVTLPSIVIDFTILAHEIGHSLGCHHHKLQNSEPGPGVFNYSAGWRWNNLEDRYCSIMTYESGQYFDNGLAHSRIPYFSNPDIYFEGKQIGNAIDGDNARTIRETKHVIAAYSDFLGTPHRELEMITLSPNPTSGILEISTQNSIINVKVYDTQGKLLQKGTSSRVDFEGYTNGLYLVQVETYEGSILKKVIKQ